MFDEIDEADWAAEEARYKAEVEYYQQQVAEWKPLQAAAQAQYPNACPYCYGSGIVHYNYDPSPAGIGLSPGSMAEVEPCPHCAQEGICPRCGEEGVDPDAAEGEMECPHCGWTEKDTEMVLPPEPEF